MSDNMELTRKRKYSGKKTNPNANGRNRHTQYKDDNTPMSVATSITNTEGSNGQPRSLSDVTTCFEVAEETAWTSDSESEAESVSLELQPENVGNRSTVALNSASLDNAASYSDATDSVSVDDASSYADTAPHTSKETDKNLTREFSKENGTNRPPLTELAPNSLTGDSTTSWSQYQQRQLEWALGKYPKYSKDRWENVAKAVPEKTMVRWFVCVCVCVCEWVGGCGRE